MSLYIRREGGRLPECKNPPPVLVNAPSEASPLLHACQLSAPWVLARTVTVVSNKNIIPKNCKPPPSCKPPHCVFCISHLHYALLYIGIVMDVQGSRIEQSWIDQFAGAGTFSCITDADSHYFVPACEKCNILTGPYARRGPLPPTAKVPVIFQEWFIVGAVSLKHPPPRFRSREYIACYIFFLKGASKIFRS